MCGIRCNSISIASADFTPHLPTQHIPPFRFRAPLYCNARPSPFSPPQLVFRLACSLKFPTLLADLFFLLDFKGSGRLRSHAPWGWKAQSCTLHHNAFRFSVNLTSGTIFSNGSPTLNVVGSKSLHVNIKCCGFDVAACFFPWLGHFGFSRTAETAKSCIVQLQILGLVDPQRVQVLWARHALLMT